MNHKFNLKSNKLTLTVQDIIDRPNDYDLGKFVRTQFLSLIKNENEERGSVTNVGKSKKVSHDTK